MIKKIFFIFLFYLVASGIALFAQNNEARIFSPGDELTLKVAVCGPGDELYFWWGHIGLIIEDSSTGESNFYDYGIFDFNQENFFYNFAFGRLLYSCGVSPFGWNYDVYKSTNRDITVYTLDLSYEAKLRVKKFAEFNVLPENKDYFYHHFDDNCSTRIRDIIDLAVNGQFSEKYKNEESRFTLRSHVHRHTWFSPPVDWFLSFLMGQVIDTKISVWEDMFLPSEVGNRIEEFSYIDEQGESRKLVVSKEALLVSENRPAALAKTQLQFPVKHIFSLLFISLLLSVLFAFFFYLQSKNFRVGRVLAGISMSLAGLLFGSAGTLLYFMSLFTNHDYTYQNLNMIFCTPLLLVSFPFGILYAVTGKQEKLKKYSALLRTIWLLCAVGVIISMLIKILPWFYQGNLTDQLLILPLALVFSYQSTGFKEYLKKWGINWA